MTTTTACFKFFDTYIYPWKLWVYVGNDFKLLSDQFYGGYEKEVLRTDFIKGHEAVTYIVQEKTSGQYGSLIATESKKWLTTGLIAHESTHAARDLWSHVREDTTGIEADAYLVGYIANCIEMCKKTNKKYK
jgi:hypothetical protein